jgi:DNA-binding NarL/FixJ family response regulator
VARGYLCDDFQVTKTVTSVLIVDDHAAFRTSLRRLLEVDGFEVVGEAADGASGLARARELQPDLVVVDVGLPDASGFDVAERLRGLPSKVVLVSSRREAGRGVTRSGAVGFVPKELLCGATLAALVGERR